MRLSSGKVLHALGLTAVVLFTLFPFFWMVSASFKSQSDILASPPVWLFTPTLDHYREIFADSKVLGGVGNSLIIAICTTALAVALGHLRPMP